MLKRILNCRLGLHLAVTNGHLSVVQSLLDVGGKRLNVNVENSAGETALSLAAKGDHKSIVRWLFKAKGLKLSENHVYKIVSYAVEHGGFEMAKLVQSEYEEREEKELAPYYVASSINRCVVLSTKPNLPGGNRKGKSPQEIIEIHKKLILNWFRTKSSTNPSAKKGKETPAEILQDLTDYFDCGICFEEFTGEVCGTID